MATTILELEIENSGEAVKSIISTLASDMAITESDRAAFSRLNADGYGEMIDECLATMYGENILRKLASANYLDVPMWKVNISAYLKRRVEYFKKCFLYIDAEYNPVENYMGTEKETTREDRGKRYTSQNAKYGEDKTHYEYDERKTHTTFGGYTDTTTIADVTETTTTADVTETSTLAERTTTNEAAPFDKETFYNTDRATEKMKSGEEDSKTIAHDDDDTKTISHDGDDTLQHGQHTDLFIDDEREDVTTRDEKTDTISTTANSYQDFIVREFSRHGNIGVLSAGELMERDQKFWTAFHWIYDTTHDISNLISTGVWAL